MISGFCPSCNRTLYVDESTTPFCPVCSSPVLASLTPERDRDGTTGERTTDEDASAEQIP